MSKILFTTGCGYDELGWKSILALTTPRMRGYASVHGYDFKEVWYSDLNDEWRYVFEHPDDFVKGAVNYELRQDFIRWKGDRTKLAPNWLRYAMMDQLLQEYDTVVYLDADVMICDIARDVLEFMPEDKWIGAPINGPSPDNAGPGGPMMISRSCEQAKRFWFDVWFGRKWITHPLWTDGLDFMDMLGYTTEEPIHKHRTTEYDSSFYTVPPEWLAWWPNYGKMVHVAGGGGSGNVDWKLPKLQEMKRMYNL